MAGIGRVRSADERLAPFQSGRAGHRRTAGQERCHAANAGVDVRHGFFRSDGAPHPAGAAIRHHRAGGSVYFYADCAGRGAGNQSRLHERALRDGAAPASHFLAERAAGNGFRPRVQESASHQLLGSRTGYVAFARFVLVVYPLSDDDQARIRSDGQETCFPRTGRRGQRSGGKQAVATAHWRTIGNSRHEVHAFRRAGAPLAVDPEMSEPVHIAAIDAGSNAVRLSVARAYSALDIEPLHTERYPLRLGESVFVRHRFSEGIFKKAAKAFRHFREVMDEFGVTRYRAVATSATREAQNRKAFVRTIKKRSGTALEVIGAGEESRLGREAVLAACGPEAPRCIVDLGGGSLEISILREHAVEQAAQIPVGTVLLLTTLNLPGVIRPVQGEQVRRYVRALLESKLAPRPNLGESMAVALGGNAETLANVAPGPRQQGLSTMELSLLRARLPDILRRDVRARMKAYAVRRDRADVMGIAAITFITLGRYLNLRTFAIPGVGVREGVLQDIARDVFSRKEPHRYNAAARQLIVGTRSFARRLG